MKIVAKPGTPPEVIDVLREMFEGKEGAPDEVMVMDSEEFKKAREDGTLPPDLKKIEEGGGPGLLNAMLGKIAGSGAIGGLMAGLMARGMNIENIPYNGVEGDSCDCEACNLRRLLRGPDEDLNAEQEREPDEEELAKVKKRVEFLATEELMLAPFEKIDPEGPEYEALSDEDKAKVKLARFLEMEAGLNKRMNAIVEAGMKTASLIRILSMMARREVHDGEKLKGLGLMTENLIMSMMAALLDQMGVKKTED